MQNKDKKIIVLVGMMGCGKSTIGSRLAKKLNIGFVDLDKYIENNQNKSTKKIFKEDGEEYFRKIEEDLAKEIILKNEPAVLSLGGGAFINDNIRNLIKETCVSIWLDADIDVILERIGDKTNRPLLNNVDKREVLTKLIEQRSPFYKQSDLTINASNASHSESVNKIILELQKII